MRQGIEAETVNDRVLYLLRTIESGGGDRNRKKRNEAELTRMKEARREHVIVPVTSVFHLNSLTEIVAHMDLQIAEGLRGDSAGHGVDTTLESKSGPGGSSVDSGVGAERRSVRVAATLTPSARRSWVYPSSNLDCPALGTNDYDR